MKKFLTFFTISVLFAFYCDTEVTAQGFDLKFNRVLIVNDNQQIVPTGTVWKINSIYGEETNVCINVVCASTYWYAKGIVSGMYVNGTLIPSSIRGFKTNHTIYSSTDCSSGSSSGYDVSCANKTTDPNILPIWLPEGTTLKSCGPNVFISVIEFLVQ